MGIPCWCQRCALICKVCERTEDEMRVAKNPRKPCCYTPGQNGARSSLWKNSSMISPSVFNTPTSKFGLECSFPCTTVLYFMMIESNPEKKKINKATLKLWLCLPEISPPTVERCHSKPTLVWESLFNLYYWTAEEHHTARSVYYLWGPSVTHTHTHTHCLHQLTSVLFPLGCHDNHSTFYTYTLLVKCTWLSHTPHPG